MLLCDIAECFDYFTRTINASEDEDTPTGSHYNPLEICGGYVIMYSNPRCCEMQRPELQHDMLSLALLVARWSGSVFCRPQPGAAEAREEAFKNGPLAQLVSNAKAVRREQPAVNLVEVPPFFLQLLVSRCAVFLLCVTEGP